MTVKYVYIMCMQNVCRIIGIASKYMQYLVHVRIENFDGLFRKIENYCTGM